jgi:hypothetical protein
MVYNSDILRVKDKNAWVKSHEEILEEIQSKNFIGALTTHMN